MIVRVTSDLPSGRHARIWIVHHGHQYAGVVRVDDTEPMMTAPNRPEPALCVDLAIALMEASSPTP